MPRGFAGETVAQEARGGSRAAVARGRTSAYGSRSRGMGSAARATQDRGSAIREVQQRGERAEARTPQMPSLITGLASALGAFTRKKIIEGLEAGGTPVRQDGMVIGVMRDGRYTGRPRATADERDDEPTPAAEMGAAAPQPQQPAEAGPATVRRSALAQQIEAENRRRRLAGMRRLGARTLLSGDRFTADTLGAG